MRFGTVSPATWLFIVAIVGAAARCAAEPDAGDVLPADTVPMREDGEIPEVEPEVETEIETEEDEASITLSDQKPLCSNYTSKILSEAVPQFARAKKDLARKTGQDRERNVLKG